MWFFTEFLERYTRSLARSVWRFAGVDDEAARRPSGVGIKRESENGLILPERSLTAPLSYVAERRNPVPTDSAPAKPCAVPDVEAAAAEPGPHTAEAAPRDGDAAQPAALSLETMPVGVRGELVLKYSEALSSASEREAAGLIEKLGKDKKVRIAELQLITADVLGEEVTRRTKTEHLSALRENLGCERHAAVQAGNGTASAEIRTH